MQQQQQLCRVPKVLAFEYHQGQQLNTTLVIQNLVDKVVDFKIKSNKPELYLVKPMQGSIYKHQTLKVIFKRKQLIKSDFQGYLRNPSLLQEKFLVEIKCIQRDVIGMQKTLTQSVIVIATFNIQSKLQPDTQTAATVDSKKQQMFNELKERVSYKENQLSRLVNQQIKMIKKVQVPKEDSSINKTDLIILFIVFLIVGMALGG